MERYTQWRDKATGISPFLPVLHTSVIGTSESPVANFIKTVKLDSLFRIILFSLKIVLILPFLLLSVVIGSLAGHSKAQPLNRLILLTSGLTSYELTIQNLKAKNLNKSFYPNKNDVFLVNCSSPLDLLTLLLISNDEFVILVPNSKGNLTIQSNWSFVQKSLSGVSIDDEDDKIDFTILQNKVIYIFPEATTSNGKAILPFKLNQQSFNAFIEKLQSDKKTHKIRTLGLKYYPSTLVTPLSYTTSAFLYKVLSTLSYSVKIRINIANELDSNDTDLKKLRSSFLNNGKFKLISEDLNIESKRKFIENYVGRR